MTTDINALNDDLLRELLKRLPQKDQAAFGATQKSFHDVIDDEAKNWKVVLNDKWPTLPDSRKSIFSVASTFEKLYQSFLLDYTNKTKTQTTNKAKHFTYSILLLKPRIEEATTPFVQIDFEFKRDYCTFQITPLKPLTDNIFSAKCTFPIVEQSMKYSLVFGKEEDREWREKELIPNVGPNDPNTLEFFLSTRIDVFRYSAYFSFGPSGGLSYILDHGHVCFAQSEKVYTFSLLMQLLTRKNKILPAHVDPKPEKKICKTGLESGSDKIMALYHDSLREYKPHEDNS